jgi:hypothetical protein
MPPIAVVFQDREPDATAIRRKDRVAAERVRLHVAVEHRISPVVDVARDDYGACVAREGVNSGFCGCGSKSWG